MCADVHLNPGAHEPQKRLPYSQCSRFSHDYRHVIVCLDRHINLAFIIFSQKIVYDCSIPNIVGAM